MLGRRTAHDDPATGGRELAELVALASSRLLALTAKHAINLAAKVIHRVWP